MANEFVTRNGFISLDNSQITGSLKVTQGVTASLFGTASFADNATSAATASSADSFLIRQNATASNILVNNTLTAQTLVVQTVTSSIVYSSGSNIFGNQLTNVQQFTGSLRVTGSGDHFVMGGNVGINTTSPLVKLDVNGDSRFVGTAGAPAVQITSAGSSFGVLGVSGSQAGDVNWLVMSGYPNAGDFTIRQSDVLDAITAKKTTGNVGINTASPVYKLDVNGTGNFSNNLIVTGSFTALGSGLFTGSLTVGSGSIGSNENTLIIGPAPSGGTGEGGQLLLSAKGGIYTSASMLDTYQDRFRILRGTNAGSDAFKLQLDMHTGQLQLPNYNSSGAFPGKTAANLAVDSNGNVITVSNEFVKSFAIVNNRNISTGDTGSFHIWRCNVPCTASAVSVYFDAGTNVVVNASKNASSNLLAANFTNSTADSWQSTTSLQNQNFNVNDTLQVNFVSFSGSPKEVTIQVNFTY